jgi:hypothetical protein
MPNEIVSEIRLELDAFRADLKTAQDAANQTAKKSGKAVGDGIEDGLGRAAGALKAQILAIGAAVAGAFTIGKAVEQASQQEAAIQALNSALALNGKYTDDASAHFLTYADTLARATTASNDAIVKGGATLAQFGKLSGDSLDRATKAALDFAATGRVGLEEAFNLIGKAADGNVAALGRYGVKVHSTGDEAQDFAKALKLLEERFGGLAELQTNTFAGAMQQAHNAFDEVLEAVGNLIIKSPTMIKIIHLVTEAFLAAAKALEDWGDDRDVINDLTNSMAQLGKTAAIVSSPFEFLFNLLNLGFQATRLMIQQVLTDFAKLDAFVADGLAKLGIISQETASGFDAAAQVYSAALADMETKTMAASDKLFDFNVTAKIEEFSGKLEEFAAAVEPLATSKFEEISQKAADAQKPALIAGWDFMVNGFNSAFGRVKLLGEDFRAQLQGKLNAAFSSFRDGVAHSFASIGDALVKGKNAFLAFGQALLGVFGDLAIQIGTFYFLLGLANLFLNPAAAAAEIAGGLALIVLGGALKAFAQTSGNGMASSAGAAGGGAAPAGGGVAADPNLSTASPDHFNDRQRGQGGTKVEIHVQGNILDRRQTGLELAEVINEAFGSNGVTYATGAGS